MLNAKLPTSLQSPPCRMNYVTDVQNEASTVLTAVAAGVGLQAKEAKTGMLSSGEVHSTTTCVHCETLLLFIGTAKTVQHSCGRCQIASQRGQIGVC